MSTLWRVLVLVAVTLIVGTGLCLFHADDATGPGLCGLVLLPVVGLVAMSPRPLVGRFVPEVLPIHPADPLDRPVPPPRA